MNAQEVLDDATNEQEPFEVVDLPPEDDEEDHSSDMARDLLVFASRIQLLSIACAILSLAGFVTYFLNINMNLVALYGVSSLLLGVAVTALTTGSGIKNIINNHVTKR